MFQFTHPGGVRRRLTHSITNLINSFNSRTREGCDALGADSPRCYRGVSIHAPGRGATARDGASRYCVYRFNSRTREGCDTFKDGVGNLAGKFQFTHPGGVRPLVPHTLARCSQFQFTHPGGVRQSLTPREVSIKRRFNSRTREGCDTSGEGTSSRS